MNEERFLVTGALGCVGAWTVKQLVDEGVPVVAFDLPSDPHRLRLVMAPEKLSLVRFASGDLCDLEGFERIVVENGITRVIHLAALQVPYVKANPVRGAQVNVQGMAVVLETVRRHVTQVRSLVYASSVAVYGRVEAGVQPAEPPANTASLYGVFKRAGEEMARVYWQDYGLSSVGLRPHTVYGPGRDQGMTSLPTKAMLAAAAGQAYHIGYGGYAVYQHGSDAAQAFVAAARAGVQGAAVFNVPGTRAPMEEIVAAIDGAAPEAAGKITFDPAPLPIPGAVDTSGFAHAVGPLSVLSIFEGVSQTVAHFRAAIGRGIIEPPPR